MARSRVTPRATIVADTVGAGVAPEPPARRVSASEFVREESLTASLRGIVLTVYPHQKLTRSEWRDLLQQTLQRPIP